MPDDGEPDQGVAPGSVYPVNLTVTGGGATVLADSLTDAPSIKSVDGALHGIAFDIPPGTRASHRWTRDASAQPYRHPLTEQDRELRLEITAPGFDGSANAFVAFFSNGAEIEIVRRKVWPSIRDWRVPRPIDADSAEFGFELAGTGRFRRFDIKVDLDRGATWAPIVPSQSNLGIRSTVRCWPAPPLDVVLHGSCTTSPNSATLIVGDPPNDDYSTSSLHLEAVIEVPQQASGSLLIRCTATSGGSVEGVFSWTAPGGDIVSKPLVRGTEKSCDLVIPMTPGSRELTVALSVEGSGRFERPRFSVLPLGAAGTALHDLYVLGFDVTNRLSVAQVAARHGAPTLATAMEDIRRSLELKRLPQPLLDLGAFLERRDAYRRSGSPAPETIDIGLESLLLPPRTATAPSAARSKRIAYCVHSALPHHTHGYSTRTQGLARALLGADWDLRVYSRLGFPDDINATAPAALQPSEIDGVSYTTSRHHPMHGFRAPRVNKILATSEYFASVLRDFDPAIVHGASNWTTGLATILAARKLGLPSIYEVRGLWHVTRASNMPGYEDTEDYAESHRLELECCRAADRVVTITHALKRFLAECGIDAAKIVVAPNGVNLDTFVPRERDDALLEEIGLQGRVVFGFVGSLVSYEGVDLVFDALAAMPGSARAGLGVLIVGDGSALPFLRQRVDELGLGDLVRFTGRVPFEDVPRYYSIIDVAPFPRRSVLVTELVSPLKPFEAMAMGKTVIASDVEAHREFIEDGVNGRLFRKDDVGDLARVMREIADDPSTQGRLRAAARAFVETRRTWSYVTEPIGALYRELGAG